MESQNVIEVHDVEKQFKIYSDRGRQLKDYFSTRGRNKYELRQVLRGISFEVKKGESVGLIGRNGSGKSTTLKLLSKIIRPSRGTIEIRGRVSSLLELGAGFHPDLSGRKNIYMNASIFGLTKGEIDHRIGDIIRFSELEDYIDNPIRTYSSGMYMRLAFAVAINVDADILLIDEILAVGDISFQTKCFEKLQEIKAAGTTIIIVSHSLDQIEKICDKSIWIEDGKIRLSGKPREVHQEYLYAMEQERLRKYEQQHIGETAVKEIDIEDDAEEDAQTGANETEEMKTEATKTEEINTEGTKTEDTETASLLDGIKTEPGELVNLLYRTDPKAKRRGNKKVVFKCLNVLNGAGRQSIIFTTGDKMFVYLKMQSEMEKVNGTVGIVFFRDDGLYCYGTNTFIEYQRIVDLGGTKELLVEIERIMLLPGKYYLTVGMHDDKTAAVFDQIDDAISFQVMDCKGDIGVCRMDTVWTLK